MGGLRSRILSQSRSGGLVRPRPCRRRWPQEPPALEDLRGKVVRTAAWLEGARIALSGREALRLEVATRPDTSGNDFPVASFVVAACYTLPSIRLIARFIPRLLHKRATKSTRVFIDRRRASRDKITVMTSSRIRPIDRSISRRRIHLL